MTEIIAHRCNTIDDALARIAGGFQSIEFDVHLASGVPVVTHDTWHGKKMVMSMDPARFQRLDAYAEAVLFPHPYVRAFVEVKSDSIRHFGHLRTANLVLETLRRVRGQVVVISFDLRFVETLKRHTNCPVGFLTAHPEDVNHGLEFDYYLCHLSMLPKSLPRREERQWIVYGVESREAKTLAELAGAWGVITGNADLA